MRITVGCTKWDFFKARVSNYRQLHMPPDQFFGENVIFGLVEGHLAIAIGYQKQHFAIRNSNAYGLRNRSLESLNLSQKISSKTPRLIIWP